MKTRSFRLLVAPIVVLLGMIVSSTANADLTIRKVINCDRGGDVQRALDRNIWSLPMKLRLVGRCSGFEIRRDDVSIAPLHGHACPGAWVDGTIHLDDAQRVQIRCIEVTVDEDPGIDAFGSTALLVDVDLSDNGGAGLESTGYSSIEMQRGSITGNGDAGVNVDGKGSARIEGTHIAGNGGAGISASQNSLVFVADGWIIDNDGSGILLQSSSVATVDDMTISDNGRAGVAVLSGSEVAIEGSTISDNGTDGPGSGVFARLNSSVEIVSSIISGNLAGVAVREHSFADISGTHEVDGETRITNNSLPGITLTNDSGVILGAGTFVPNNGSINAVECRDKESSIAVNPAAVVGSIDCPDRDF